MELQEWRRSDRATPSAWEAALLERRQLTLATLEFGLPRELAEAEGFIAGGDPVCSVYSAAALDSLLVLLEQRDAEFPGQTLAGYLLPHLPLQDATALETRLDSGDPGFRVSNTPRLRARTATGAKLRRVMGELACLKTPVSAAIFKLIGLRAQLAPILEATEDDDFGVAVRADLLDNEAMDVLLKRWEEDLEQSRNLAMAARRRVILAVHLAVLHAVDQGTVGDDVHTALDQGTVGDGAVGDDVHTTILHLAPELHDRIFGEPGRLDPCTEPPQDEDEHQRQKTRTDVALQQLIREVGAQMEPRAFINFSLAQCRRELVELEGDLMRKELRLRIMRSTQDGILALASVLDSMEMIDKELVAHLRCPTLLGSKVSQNELPATDGLFFPGLSNLSEDELQKTERRNISATF